MVYKVLVFVLLFTGFAFSSSKEVVQRRINGILSKLPSSTNMGILIFNPLTQDTIFAMNHTKSMIPASNTKLFTTATALAVMGGDYPLSTKLLTDDRIINDGTIDGNIYIKGFGNPLFTDADLENMVRHLKQKGIRSVTGNVIGDDTFFDNIYTRDDWIKDEKANVKLPAISALVVDRNKQITYRKRGRRTRSYTNYINDPPSYAAILLKAKLINNGIDVLGSALKGITPTGILELTESEVSLREVIGLVNKNSDNFVAECLFKSIGAAASGKQGNSFYSTQAILSFIDDNGIFSEGTAVVDGSGISRFNQITVGAIAGLLEKMYFDLVNYEDFYNSLSIAGVDGTLRNRMIGTRAENNFRGKTGTLNGVSSLSGYLTTSGNEDLIISIFFEFNRGSWGYYKDIQDEIVQALAEWN